MTQTQETHPVKKRHPALGASFAILGALLFGINASTSKVIIAAGVAPNQIVMFRSFATACLAAVALLFTNRQAFKLSKRETPRLVIFGVFGVALMQWAYSSAVSNLPIGIALLVEYTAIIWVPLVSLILYRIKPPKIVWIGVALVLAGLVVVSNLFSGASLSPLGLFYAALAASFLTYYFIVGKQIQNRRDTMSTLMYSMFTAGLFWSLFTFSSPAFPDLATGVRLLGLASDPLPLWLALIWLGVMGSFVPMWLSYRAMHHLSSTAAGIASTSETVFAFLFAMLLLGETFTGTQLVGGVLVLSGIVIAQIAERNRPTEEGLHQ